MILNKRIKREFVENFGRYFSLIFLVLISSMLIVAFVNSTDCIISTGKNAAIQNNIEDGEFSCNIKLSNNTLEQIKKLGVDIEESFYVDYKVNNNRTIRIFKERKNINKISINEGSNLNGIGQIVIDQHFGEVNKYKLLSNITIKNNKFTIVGYGAAPDYTYVTEKISDLTPDSKKFGIGFVSEEDFTQLNNKKYSYVFKLNGVSAEKIKNIISKHCSELEFVNSSDNMRIQKYIDDSTVNKNVAIIMGVILFIMIGFMISLSVINSIDKESSIIGALYSLGYIKSEIIRHFMILPTIVVSIGAVIGTIVGFAIQGLLSKATIKVYGLPNIQRIFSFYLIIIGIVVPIATVVVINYFIISKKLNSTPLQLLRREQKASKLKSIKINHFGFVTKFRIREFLREIRGNIIVFMGIFIASFLIIFGVAINSAIKGYVNDIKNQIVYDSMYILKLPIEVEENEDVEKATFKKVSINSYDSNMNIILQGINENSNFFSFNILEDDDKLYISENVQKKFNLNIGDTITLNDKNENKEFTLKVDKIVDYKPGLNIFMSRKSLNLLLKKDKSYFNGYFAKDKLNINEDYIFSETTSKDVITAAENMISMMMPIIIVLIVCSVLLFVINMYLLLKLMIDKSIPSISLMKIFGFNKKEINKLYIGSYFYTVLCSSIISIPLSVKITDLIYPLLIADIETYYSTQLNFYYYLFVAIVIIFSYIFSNRLIKRHIDSISLNEALRNRD